MNEILEKLSVADLVTVADNLKLAISHMKDEDTVKSFEISTSDGNVVYLNLTREQLRAMLCQVAKAWVELSRKGW